MATTGVVYARVDLNLKTRTERILSQLGVTPSELIRIVYSLIDLNSGIPFDIRLPYGKPEAFGSMTMEERDEGLRKGMTSIKAGDVYTVDEVDAEMAREFGI